MTTATEEQNQGQSPHVQLMSTPISMNCHFSASIGHALTAAHRLCRMAETATEKAAEAAQQGRRENAAGESSAGGLYAAHAQATIEQARTDHKNIRRRDNQKLESMEKRAQASDQRASEIHTANASPNARGKKVDATFIAIAIGMRNAWTKEIEELTAQAKRKPENLLEILQTCHQLGNLLATHDPGFLTENVDEPTGHRGYDEAGSAAHRQANIIRELQKEYIQRAPLVLSPGMQAAEKAAATVKTEYIPTFGCCTGIWLDADAQGLPDPSTLILWVAYHHEGRNLAKRVEEPYPKSVPAHTALVHANRVNEVPRATGFNPGTDQGCLAKMSELAEINQRAAETGTHTLGPNTMAAACEEAERLGIPRSLRAKMIRGLTADDPLVEARVLAGTTGMTRTSVSCDQADAIAQAAETAGADLHAISDMLNAVGHSASVHGTDPGPLPDSTAQIMTMMLEKHGMSKPQAQAMCAPLYHNPSGRQLPGCGESP